MERESGGLDGAFGDVLDFHRKFAPHVPARRPTAWDTDRYYGLGFLSEELSELDSAMDVGDLPGVADGLADLIYVAIRCGLIWGIDLRPVWDAVHAANMRKEGGHLRSDGKVIKPADWVPPDVAGILARQGAIEVVEWTDAEVQGSEG